jgi:hypothetical protein
MLSGNGKGLMDSMRQQLSRGETLEIAGYRLSAALAMGLEQAQLRPADLGRPGRLAWFEVSTAAPGGVPSPVTAECLARWSDAGHRCDRYPVQGPAFWQTTEIEDAEALTVATVSALLAGLGAPAATTPALEALAP